MVVRLKDIRNGSTQPSSSEEPTKKNGVVRLSDIRSSTSKADPLARPVRPTQIETEPTRTPINGHVEMDEQSETPKPSKLKSIGKKLGYWIQRPSQIAAEYLTPDAPLIGRRPDGSYGEIPGTNARQAFMERTGQKPATGLGEKALGTISSFYVPGAGLTNLSALTGIAERGVAKAIPSLGNSALGRIGQKAASEAVVGAPLGVAQTQMVNPDASTGELLKGGLWGVGGGAVLGGAGKTLGEALRYGRETAESFARPTFDDASKLKPDASRSVESPTVIRRNFQEKAESSLQQFTESMHQKYNPNNANVSIESMMKPKEKKLLSQLQKDADRFKPATVEPANIRPTSETRTGNDFLDYITGSRQGTPPRLEEPTPVIEQPNVREYGTLTSLKESPKVNPQTVESIAQKGDTSYEVKPNQTTVDNANSKLDELGDDGSKSYLLNKDNKGILSSDDVALGYRLIDEYQAKGDYDSAADIALKLMQSNLEGGRSIQINSIYDRLTPEGALRTATRVFNKNVKSAADQKPLPADVAEQIIKGTNKYQQAVGENALSKNVMTIMEKVNSGGKLTDDEISTLKKFFDEAKKYVGEDKPPRVRKRDGVAKYSANQADLARKRLASARNLNFAAQSSNPVVDYAIIGADYMVQGAVKFADFAENMVREFGNNVDFDDLYVQSWGRYKRLNKLKSTEFEKMVSQAMSGQNMTDVQKTAMRRMAIELSQISGSAQREAMAELQVAFQAISETTRGKKAASLLRSAQLGNARTFIRNEVSNNLFYALDTIRRKFAVIPDMITPGGRTVFVKNNPNSWKQYFKDWASGYEYGKRGVNPKGLTSQYDLGAPAFNPTSTKMTDRVGSFLERNVGAILRASDYASANRAISTELYQLAQAKAYKEGLRGKAFKEKAESYFHNADNSMQEEALKYGEYMTFQDKNIVSDAAVALRDKVLNLGKDFGLGNIVFNYPKTPSNILMRAVDYSPLGYLKFMGQMGKAAFKKDVTKREMIDSFTRATAGTAMGAIGAYLASIGILNVLPSKDTAMNSLERSAGKIPNSLNISGLTRYVTSFGDREAAKPKQGDVYASVDWLQPMAITSSVGASFAQAQSSSRLRTTAGASDAFAQSLDAAAESAGNMSVYRNIKDLFGSEYQGAGEKAGRLLSNAATAFIPSLLGQARNSADPNIRDTKDKNIVNQIGKSIVNKTPFASRLLEKRYDTLGEEMKSDFGLPARIANSFINPSIIDQYKPTEGAKVVLDIIDRTGETRLAPNSPSKSFTFKKETYSYTPDEYRKLQQDLGKKVQEGLKKNLSYLQNPSITDQKKIGRIDDIMTDSLEKSKLAYRKEKGIR